jgi:hypothetical protein
MGRCWLWNGYVDQGGYGCVRRGPKVAKVHRAVYEELVGPIPPGLELDHLCRVRHCYNPDHLEPVTHAENVRRGRAGDFWAAKTRCPQGHPYDEANTLVNKAGGRVCLTCKRAASRATSRARRQRMGAAA